MFAPKVAKRTLICCIKYALLNSTSLEFYIQIHRSTCTWIGPTLIPQPPLLLLLSSSNFCMISLCLLSYSCLSLSHTSLTSVIFLSILPICSLYFSSCVLMSISNCSLSCSRPLISSSTLSAFFCERKAKMYHSLIAVRAYQTH